jgi:1-acyl-sn-glycerol-3-phosphate acyltransferase
VATNAPARRDEVDPMPQERELTAGLHGRVTGRAGVAYRVARLGWRLVAACLRVRIRIEGLEHLPRTGAFIVAGAPHRTWVDPFLLWGWLPAEPRLVFFGDARAMGRSRLRRAVLRLVGGVIPIPSSHRAGAADEHFAAATEALAAGAAFCLFPETGPAAPLRSIRRLGAGVGYIALRSGVPVVPIAIGGNHELFLGRTIVVRVLPSMSALERAGLAEPPVPGSPEEREAVHRVLGGLAAVYATAVGEVHDAAEPPHGTRKRLTWLTTLFR